MIKKKLIVLTGAGISAESGLKTFRDSNGLWENYKIEEVATPRAFANNPQLVLDFYNLRRKEVAAAKPNNAHLQLALLEEDFDITIITQNIDDLHERAGSKNVIHLHGQIFEMRSVHNSNIIYEIRDKIMLGDLAEDGSQLRPNIVWFEEAVPMIEVAAQIVKQADIFVVIGTSLQVYPAAGLMDIISYNTPKFIIDKKIPEASKYISNLTIIQEQASIGVTQLASILQKLK